METIKVTDKEFDLMIKIKNAQNEPGHSNFVTDSASSKVNAGVLSSLKRKGLIYDCYEDVAKKDFGGPRFKMWCFTNEAVKNFGIPNESWKIGYEEEDKIYKEKIAKECDDYFVKKLGMTWVTK